MKKRNEADAYVDPDAHAAAEESRRVRAAASGYRKLTHVDLGISGAAWEGLNMVERANLATFLHALIRRAQAARDASPGTIAQADAIEELETLAISVASAVNAISRYGGTCEIAPEPVDILSGDTKPRNRDRKYFGKKK